MGNPGSSGSGAIVRDSYGCFIMAGCFFFDHGTSLRTELLVILKGLQLCQQHGYIPLEVEVDSKLLVDMTFGQHA